MTKKPTLVFKHEFTNQNPGRLDDYYDCDRKNFLGEGSYGRVTKAKDKTTGANRAIKAIDVGKITDHTRFEEEILIQQELDHPNIVKLYEVFKDAKRIYLVMELCLGGELFDRIVEEAEKHGEGQAFDERAAAKYMAEILGAIYYLHSHNFVHRDIKPENFLLQSKAADAPIKVIDFGLAKVYKPGSDPMITKAGTPYYVAPQVLMGKYDEKCDLWSCGVIMYILLCGYPPFYGDRDEDILAMVKKGNFDFPSPDWDEISQPAKDLISKMLTFDPKNRCSAKDLVGNDPWLKGNLEAKKGTVHKALGNRLRDFRGHSKLKKIALTLIAKQLEDDDIEELKNTFQLLDTNQDGMLSLQEVEEGMKTHKVDVSADFKEVLLQLDTDGSGNIDYTEFIAATMTTRQYLKKEVMWAAFRTFDKDGDGTITKAELAAMLTGGMESKDNDQAQVFKSVETIIKEVDLDGDGLISYDEFCKMMEKR